MALGLEILTSELDRKETAFQSLPQSELMRRKQAARTGNVSQPLAELLVTEKVLNDKAAAAREMSLSMQGDPRTVAQQNEAALVNKATAEVAEAVGQANANKMQRQQKNMQKLVNMDPRMLQGITRAPVQQRQVMAEGGIVGYIAQEIEKERAKLEQDGEPVIRGLTAEDRAKAMEFGLSDALGTVGTLAALHPLGRGIIGGGYKIR